MKTDIFQLMSIYKVPGVGVAYVRDFAIESVKNYGLSILKSRQPVTELTLFQAASVSKTVGALVALLLVEQGKLKLDVDIGNYLRLWKIPANEFKQSNPITLRLLLSHGAGLNIHGFAGYNRNIEQLPRLKQILDGTPPANSEPIRVVQPPGLEKKYSGGGYVILQQLLEDISGLSFSELANQLIFAPLE